LGEEMMKKVIFSVFILTLGLFLAGCGGDGGESEDPNFGIDTDIHDNRFIGTWRSSINDYTKVDIEFIDDENVAIVNYINTPRWSGKGKYRFDDVHIAFINIEYLFEGAPITSHTNGWAMGYFLKDTTLELYPLSVNNLIDGDAYHKQ